ncbi:vitamin B12 ABC transporter ATP-binding protein BtuD [Enterobacter quasihormaechei]|uniref:vitamin B12 ABC transporter ATP-binding protein BtuD n=1 Tax=Enterobacter quasihormaechei TaxID=2529382 RepID=UPI002FD28CBE
MSLLMQLTDVAGKGRLEPVTATVNAGEMLHLVGPNGAGKSTLLARMAGLTAGEGEITFLGQSLDEWLPATLASRRSYLVQQQVPPFAMPVWHYLMLHLPDKNQVALLHDVTAALGLDDKLTRQASQLSGGEWQRVRLAAVILQIHPSGNPHGRLLLLDEPMSGLDVAQQAALDALLSALCRKGITIVMSSHDLNHTLRHAHRVWLLARGKLIASGPRDSVLTASNLASAYHMSFRRLDIEGHKMLISTAQE